MEQHTLKNVNNYLNTNIYSYLETSGGQSSNLYLNVGSFFQHQCRLDTCGSLRQLSSCIGNYLQKILKGEKLIKLGFGLRRVTLKPI